MVNNKNPLFSLLKPVVEKSDNTSVNYNPLIRELQNNNNPEITLNTLLQINNQNQNRIKYEQYLDQRRRRRAKLEKIVREQHRNRQSTSLWNGLRDLETLDTPEGMELYRMNREDEEAESKYINSLPQWKKYFTYANKLVNSGFIPVGGGTSGTVSARTPVQTIGSFFKRFTQKQPTLPSYEKDYFENFLSGNKPSYLIDSKHLSQLKSPLNKSEINYEIWSYKPDSELSLLVNQDKLKSTLEFYRPIFEQRLGLTKVDPKGLLGKPNLYNYLKTHPELISAKINSNYQDLIGLMLGYGKDSFLFPSVIKRLGNFGPTIDTFNKATPFELQQIANDIRTTYSGVKSSIPEIIAKNVERGKFKARHSDINGGHVGFNLLARTPQQTLSAFVSKFGEPFKYDESGLFIPNSNYNFRNGWGLIEDALKTKKIRVPEGDYKPAVLEKYPFLKESPGLFSTVRDMSFKFPYFQRGESIWPFKTKVQAEDLIVVPNELPNISWNKVSKFGSIYRDKLAEIGDKTTPLLDGKENILPSENALFFRLNKTTNKYEPYGETPVLGGWGLYSNRYKNGFSSTYFSYPDYLKEPINIRPVTSP